MRSLFLILLLVSASFCQEPVIKRVVTVSTDVSCPDDILTMRAISSDGKPAAGIELRLVLHSPYQGLRAVKTTDSSGEATAELTKPGEYRIYIRTDAYNHKDFEEFDYPSMCPPPPPEDFDIQVQPDCNNSLLLITVSQDGMPLSDVMISTFNWSSTSSADGLAAFPLDEGYAYVTAEKAGFTMKGLWVNVSCAPPPLPPPPECLQDGDCAFDQLCANQSCIDITGECGYPENHSWIDYECCDDEGCGYLMICENNTCELEPQPIKNETNITSNETAVDDERPQGVCIAALLPLLLLGARR